MINNKEHEVTVEIGYVVLYWTCPNCKKDIRDEIERFHVVEQLKCDCGLVLEKQGEARWIVK